MQLNDTPLAQIKEIQISSTSRYSDYCSKIIGDIQPSKEDVNDLDVTIKFSILNLLRFSKFINSMRWTTQLHDIYMNVIPLGGLARLEKTDPELYDAYSIGDINQPGWGLAYGPRQWGNIQAWFESNIKHLYLSSNPTCGFNYGVISSLAAQGITKLWYDNELNLISENVKSVLDLNSIHQKKISVKNDIAREDCYRGIVNIGELPHNFRYDRYLLYVFNCIGVYGLKLAKDNFEILPKEIKNRDNLINLFLYWLVLQIDTIVAGYHSQGKLLKNKAYIKKLGSLFEVKNYDLFDEIVEMIVPLGKQYLEPVYKLIIQRAHNN